MTRGNWRSVESFQVDVMAAIINVAIRLTQVLMIYSCILESSRNLGKPKYHIIILRGFGDGGNLGRCNKDAFDQSKCSDKNNLKPLECKSYPFFPFMCGNKIGLRVDPHCPIPNGLLKDHYKRVLTLWERTINVEPAIKDWISSIDLEGYGYEEFRLTRTIRICKRSSV